MANSSCPFGLIEQCLVRPDVDLEQQFADLDVASFLEGHLGEIPGDARPDIDRVDRVGAARVIDIVDNFVLDGLADVDDRRAGIRRRSLTVAAAERRRELENHNGQQQAGIHAKIGSRRERFRQWRKEI